MAPRRRMGSERSTPKIAILMSLIVLLTSITSMVMSSYPQHLYIDNKTVILNAIGFLDNNTVNIRGHQTQYGAGDSIAIDGRDYIRITGRQVQLGSSNFSEGIRTLTASLTDNVLFQQMIGTFTINQVAQVGVDGETVSIIPISMNVVNIRTDDSVYNIEFVQDTTFITTKNKVMLKLTKEKDTITIFVVGIKNYQNIWMRII